jgi:Ca-activated chloride channel homolog
MDVQLRLQHDLLAVETEHDVHAMVELDAPDAEVDADRPPLRLALVLDRSGSMAGPKLDATKRAARYLLDRLRDADELAVVTYDDTVQLVAGLAPVGAGDLRDRITAIGPGGMTNLSGGWLKGVEELRHSGGATRRALLLTDGLANVGITDPDQLTLMAGNVADTGVTTTTLGFGDQFNDELLTSMADAGRGQAHHIASVDDAPAAFAAEFEGLVSMVAQNVSVEIRPTPDVQLVAVLNEYPSTAVAGGIQVLAGDAYAGSKLRVVFRLHVPELPTLGARRIAAVVVRYTTVGEEVAAHEVTYPLEVNLVSSDEAAGADPDAAVPEEVTVLLAAQATDDARRLADAGEHDAAKRRLGEVVAELRRLAPGSERTEDLLAKARSLEDVERVLDRTSYSPTLRKQMHYRSHERKRRRPTQRDD